MTRESATSTLGLIAAPAWSAAERDLPTAQKALPPDGELCPRCGFRLLGITARTEFPMCRRCGFEDYTYQPKYPIGGKTALLVARYGGEQDAVVGEIATRVVVLELKRAEGKRRERLVPTCPFCSKQMDKVYQPHGIEKVKRGTPWACRNGHRIHLREIGEDITWE